MLSNRSSVFVRSVSRGLVAWPCAALVLAACSAPLDDEEADGPPEFGGPVPGSATNGNLVTPGNVTPGNVTPGNVTPGSNGATGSNPSTTPSGTNGNEQNTANGAPIAPNTGSNTGSNSGTPNSGTPSAGTGGTGGDDGNVGTGGSAIGNAGTTGMTPTTPTPTNPAPTEPTPTNPTPTTPTPTAPDIACPAGASFCSGFEGTGLPAGSRFEPDYLAADALGAQVTLDSTVAHSGRQSLKMPVGANYYRMLSVPVPSNDFWIRLYTRSNVGFGAQGSTHASLFMGSIVAPGGDYNADRAVEIAEQFGQVLLNVKDALYGTSGTNPNGQPGTRLPNDTWTCMEAHFDGNSGNINIFVEGDEIIDATGWQAPMTYRSFRFGYLRFDSPARDVWMDDVVVASARVGCQ